MEHVVGIAMNFRRVNEQNDLKGKPLAEEKVAEQREGGD